MIAFSCSFCGSTIKVSDEMAGKEAVCPQCNELQSIPLSESVNATAVAVAALDIALDVTDDRFVKRNYWMLEWFSRSYWLVGAAFGIKAAIALTYTIYDWTNSSIATAEGQIQMALVYLGGLLLSIIFGQFVRAFLDSQDNQFESHQLLLAIHAEVQRLKRR